MSTQEYIKAHIARVRKHLNVFIMLLSNRAINHDATKLGPNELPLWEKMDQEPRYPYGSPEYKNKIKRNHKVFDYHYSHNRHHPEYFQNGVLDMTLVDLTEMLCDWLGYRDNISYSEAIRIVSEQMLRYKIITEDEYEKTVHDDCVDRDDPNILKVILINTLKRYFAVLGGLDGEPDGIVEELHKDNGPYFEDLRDSTIDIYC